MAVAYHRFRAGRRPGRLAGCCLAGPVLPFRLGAAASAAPSIWRQRPGRPMTRQGR